MSAAGPNGGLSEYARIGLVHHMLYARSVEDPEYHVATLTRFVQRTDIETFDCCLPYGTERRRGLIEAIRASGKEHIVVATHLFPLRKLSFASTLPAEQAQMRMLAEDLIEQGAAIGATGFILASGGPPYWEGTEANHRAFEDFLRWLCERLARHQIDALLEPFDFYFDKKFLYGPLDLNLKLMERIGRDFPNLGIELDVAHLPLMGEGFASAIRRSAPWLKRVHLGNCVMRDSQDPFFGDRHPPMGYPGGEIDVPELVEILGTLREVGFLNRANRGDLILELNPFPGKSEDESVADNLERVNRAWRQVMPAGRPGTNA